MKTLVAARHEPGPARNGHGNCFARTGTGGVCPGVETAKWLNSLGDDDDVYFGTTTVGQVRDNWLNGGGSHIVAVDPVLAELKAEERRISANLRRVKADIKRLEKIRAGAR